MTKPQIYSVPSDDEFSGPKLVPQRPGRMHGVFVGWLVALGVVAIVGAVAWAGWRVFG